MSGLFAVLATIGCISPSPTAPPSSEPASIEIMPAAIETQGGSLARFDAVVRDANGNALPEGVEWTTSDPSVIAVDSDGTLWSFSVGTADAIATLPGRSGSAPGQIKKRAQVKVSSDAPDRPGQVTDLAVVSTTVSSATLTFSETDDGQNGAADYLVRFQVAPLSWGSATAVGTGSCAAPLHGEGEGTSVTCTVESLASSTDYEFQVVAIRASDGVYGDLSNVASATTPDLPDGTPRIAPNSDSHPNEPTGYAVIAASAFPCVPALEGDCADNGDWSTNPTSDLMVIDAGGDQVLRTRFPAGLKAGTAPVQMDAWDDISSPTQMKEVYLSMHVRLVSGAGDGLYEFYSGVNKLGFFGYQGSVPSDLALRGFPDEVGAGHGVLENSLKLGISQQNNVDRAVYAGERAVVDRWYQWELQFVLNDPANNYETNGSTRGNGVFRWWQDGRLIIELTDIAYVTEQGDGYFRYRWNPTWGGGLGHSDRMRTDYIDMDDLYISGVPK